MTRALRGVAAPALAAAAAAAALLGIEGTAWAPLLHHGPLAGGGAHAGHAVPALASAAWLVGWGLMVVAMMLPGAVPFVRGVGAAVSGRSPARERGFATAGFLGVWVAAGTAALGAAALGGTIAAAPVLVAAGLYQFSPAKRRALDHCRGHARLLPPGWAAGRDPSGDALRAGLAHGTASVACCGPLMMAVVVLAMDRPLLMLAAGCAMTVEAATSLGPRISRPAGVVLLLAGAAALAL